MKITSGMLPFEVVQEVKDTVEAQIAIDRQKLACKYKRTRGAVHVDWLPAILKYGAEDREFINQAIAEGNILQGECYKECYHCCKMSIPYAVEVFDILLSYSFNVEAVKTVYLAGLLDGENEWCGLLKDGLCAIHQYKPYTCLCTSPSPHGAENEGCYFKGDKHAKTLIHKYTLIVTGRMRMLFREYLPELPEFIGKNMNQAFLWAMNQHIERRCQGD